MERQTAWRRLNLSSQVLMPSPENEKRLIFVGKPFLCHLFHEWVRQTRRVELAPTIPIPAHFSCTHFFNYYFSKLVFLEERGKE